MISPDNPMIHWTEIIVIITVSSMLIEEIRQVSREAGECGLIWDFLVSLSRQPIFARETVELLRQE